MADEAAPAGPPSSPEPAVALLGEVWSSTIALCRSFDERQWALATGCPGWSVKDQVSHVVGTERMLLGESPPPAPSPRPAHVHNAIGEVNEAWVAARRHVPGPAVLDELVEVTGRRTDELVGMTRQGWEKVGWSPIGEVPYRDFMAIRVFDCYVHEQDIRRAVGMAGHLTGPVADLAVDRVASALPYILGKLVAPPDGTVAVWEVTAPVGSASSASRELIVAMEGGRAVAVARSACFAGETVRMTMDVEAFVSLGCGRGDPAEAPVAVKGDSELAGEILRNMAFMI